MRPFPWCRQHGKSLAEKLPKLKESTAGCKILLLSNEPSPVRFSMDLANYFDQCGHPTGCRRNLVVAYRCIRNGAIHARFAHYNISASPDLAVGANRLLSSGPAQ